MTDNILHLYQCPPNQKAMDWLAAELKKKRTQSQPNPAKTHHCPQLQTHTRNWNKEKDQSPNRTCSTLQLCPMEIKR